MLINTEPEKENRVLRTKESKDQLIVNKMRYQNK